MKKYLTPLPPVCSPWVGAYAAADTDTDTDKARADVKVEARTANT